MPKFDIYEKDQAAFRGPHGARFIDEVQVPGGAWKPYYGDRIAPVMYGNFVKTDDSDDAPREQ